MGIVSRNCKLLEKAVNESDAVFAQSDKKVPKELEELKEKVLKPGKSRTQKERNIFHHSSPHADRAAAKISRWTQEVCHPVKEIKHEKREKPKAPPEDKKPSE